MCSGFVIFFRNYSDRQEFQNGDQLSRKPILREIATRHFLHIVIVTVIQVPVNTLHQSATANLSNSILIGKRHQSFQIKKKIVSASYINIKIGLWKKKMRAYCNGTIISDLLHSDTGFRFILQILNVSILMKVYIYSR